MRLHTTGKENEGTGKLLALARDDQSCHAKSWVPLIALEKKTLLNPREVDSGTG